MFAEVHLQTRYDLKEKLSSKTTQGSAKNMVSKHRWSHNTGTIYLECIALVIEKDGLPPVLRDHVFGTSLSGF
jgi:hypothetical protein